MQTAVVILNWNTKDYLAKWLPALIDSCKGLDAGVVVADSASTDGSLDLVKKDFPQVSCIRLESNFGFTGGYNRALSQIEAEYYVLLNSDIEVTPLWLRELTAFMESHPDCAICGPKLRSMASPQRFEYAGAAGGFLDFFGYPFCRGRILGKTQTDRGQYDSPAEVCWVSGAALAIRSGVWKQLGGLDDRFFAHMEEIDLCWRAWNAGWKVCVVPSACIYHLGGGTLPQNSPRKLFFNYRNNLLMLDNNLPGKVRPRIFCRMVLDGLCAAAYLLTGKAQYAKAVVKAHSQFWKMRKGPNPDAKVNMLSRRLLFMEYLKFKNI